MASTAGASNGHPGSYAAKHNLGAHFIGGNHLAKAPPSKLKDFVAAHGGHTVIGNVSAHLSLHNFLREWWRSELGAGAGLSRGS